MTTHVVEGPLFTFELEPMSDRRIYIRLVGGPHGCKTHLVASGFAAQGPEHDLGWHVDLSVEHISGRRAAKATREEVNEAARAALAQWLDTSSSAHALRSAGRVARKREVTVAAHAVREAERALVNARTRLVKAREEVRRG